MSTPNAWQTMHAIAAWQSTRARLLDHDPDLANDETALIELLGPEDGEVQDILARALRAAVHAKTMATAAAEQGKRIAARKSRYESRKDDLYRLAFRSWTRPDSAEWNCRTGKGLNYETHARSLGMLL